MNRHPWYGRRFKATAVHRAGFGEGYVAGLDPYGTIIYSLWEWAPIHGRRRKMSRSRFIRMVGPENIPPDVRRALDRRLKTYGYSAQEAA